MPKILLGLGATCLLVAAVIFLAVAWSWLGVGGRTAVLVGLTVASALGGQWLARRDLGVAAEALTTVALGLVVLDLFGAEHAGWLGAPTDESFLVIVGASLLVVSLGAVSPGPAPLRAAGAAPLGLGAGRPRAPAPNGHAQVVATVAVLCFTALAVARPRGSAPWCCRGRPATGAVLALSAPRPGSAVTEASEHPTLHGLWLEGHGLGMLAVAGLVLLPWAVVRDHDDLRQLRLRGLGLGAHLGRGAPGLRRGADRDHARRGGGLGALGGRRGAAPPRWYAVPRVPLVGSLLVLVPVPAMLAAAGGRQPVHRRRAVHRRRSVRLDPAPHPAKPLLLPLAVAVVGCWRRR